MAWLSRQHERQLAAAARADMESFASFDAETFRAVHHPDAVLVLPEGRIEGIDAIMEWFRDHFADRLAVWKYTEVNRVVSGRRSAFLLYETSYAVPSAGASARMLTGVTWTRERGSWLAIVDQSTPLA